MEGMKLLLDIAHRWDYATDPGALAAAPFAELGHLGWRYIVLPPAELAAWRFAPLAEALALLHPKLARRIVFGLRARDSGATLYLEDGRVIE